MDCDLKQWRNQHESEHQHSAKIPRLVIEVEPASAASSAALPLFVPEPISKVSAFPDHSTTTSTSRFPGMGGCLFSLTQWQELELQALIFKYLLAGTPVPSELLLHLKKSLLNTPAYYLSYPYQQYQHYQPAMLQSGYWGRSIVDPEPGRCRRTDGKKWRCSRDVVLGQKYCERHVHRGRNRSRKPVEIPTPTTATATAGGDLKTALPLTVVAPASGNHLVQHSQRASESKPGTGNPFDLHINKEECGEGQSDGKLLRHFFDDWPRNKEDTKGIGNNGSPNTTTLSISTLGRPSDFSLKLSTGNGSESESQERNTRREQYQLNWGASGWGSHQASSMGGPLAEALRSSSTSNSSSPTSVLHELRRGTASETSSFST